MRLEVLGRKELAEFDGLGYEMKDCMRKSSARMSRLALYFPDKFDL
jgi:hypothetical protein